MAPPSMYMYKNRKIGKNQKIRLTIEGTITILF